MHSSRAKALLGLTMLLILAPVVYAHTPLTKGEGNNDVESALPVSDPTKSWVLYRRLAEAGEPEFFSLELSPGERLVLSVFTPLSEGEGFAPSLVVMGPGLPTEGELPGWAEAPAGYGAVLVVGARGKPEYEAFTPGSYRFTADFELPVEEAGVYYAAVFEPDGEGRYGMAVGYREVFTLVEWLTIPFSTMTIHQWEGQPLLLILAPMLLTLVVGIYFAWRNGWARSLPGAAGLLSGLLYAGSGVSTAYQMLLASMAAPTGAALITLIFALIPLALGVLILRWAINGMRVVSAKDRAKLILFGLLGLLSWAGFLLGPAILVLLGGLPRSLPSEQVDPSPED